MTARRFISTRREGRVLVVTLERPEVLNALHPPAHLECQQAFDAFAADDDLWVAIITGAGDRAFCAGADLKHGAAGGVVELPPGGFAGLTHRFDLDKPVIAAVNGLALGGGFETALACDIVVASETARFGLPEPRVGYVALAGGLLRLPRAIGLKRAMPLILTGRQVSAEEGARLGFVSEVAPSGQALAAALQTATEICQCSPAAVRAAKRIANHSADQPLDAALRAQFDDPKVCAARSSPDALEGPRAFAERRLPHWRST